MAFTRHPRFLVVGASGRMTAAMLKRLNFECSVIDLFGDADTHAICSGRVVKVSRLEDLHLHREFVEKHEWILFAGGLESHSKVARQLCEWAKPAYASADALKLIASCDVVNAAMAKAGVAKYPFSQTSERVSFPSVAKVLNGSGRARLVRSAKDVESKPNVDWVYQPFISGNSLSIVFLADDDGARSVGATIQLVDSMSWAGSISGLKLNAEEMGNAEAFATAIAVASGIRGIFGVDFIRNESGIWPVDVNPRIPASAEIVGVETLRAHLKAFGIEVDVATGQQPASCGKLVLFNGATHSVRFSRKRLCQYPLRHECSLGQTSLADIPREDEVIQPGCPILTIFVSGKSPDEVRNGLFEKRAEIAAILGAVES